MDTRFNSFYSERPHPFVEAMGTFLQQCGMRMLRPAIVSDYIYRAQTRKFNEDIDVMRHVASTVLERRESASFRKRDLVDAMLYEKDPETGKGLPHDNIINNMITFLIAGKYPCWYCFGVVRLTFSQGMRRPRVCFLSSSTV